MLSNQVNRLLAPELTQRGVDLPLMWTGERPEREHPRLRWLGLPSLILCFLFATPVLANGLNPGGWAPPSYARPPSTKKIPLPEGEPPCPNSHAQWREAHNITGVQIEPSPACHPDDPHVVAAVTRGTNNIAPAHLRRTGLASDAVEKCCDRDGDGDPDVIRLTLEVAELNGRSPYGSRPEVQQAIAPGVTPGFWVFSPKTRGMASEGARAAKVIRAPSPSIRVEQGDTVQVTLANTHYVPHTIHFHGVDHAFQVDGRGNDGVPQTSEVPTLPTKRHTYQFTPRQPGSFFYHCHVQPNVHVLMGLNGLFVVEEQHPSNWVQTFNIGAGRVRHPAQAIHMGYDREYDLVYQGVDADLHKLIRVSNDPRVIQKAMHRQYKSSTRHPEYFLLNGLSFPYTVRESQILVKPNQRIRLRILNAGSEAIALHTHGHKATVLAYDGVEAGRTQHITRDVFHIAAAQRLDLLLKTTFDGRNAYSPGVWFLHDHREKAVTTDGIAPGGDISLITYESFLQPNGMPKTFGVSWEPYFTSAYYQGKIPVWGPKSGSGSDHPANALGEVGQWPPSWLRFVSFFGGGIGVGLLGGMTGLLLWRRRWS